MQDEQRKPLKTDEQAELPIEKDLQEYEDYFYHLYENDRL